MSGKLDCAVFDRHLVMEVFQVMVAAQMAYQRYSTGKAACRTMHAEVLYCLSAMKSISNVFATFGLDGSQRELLIVVINPHKTIVDEIQRSIDGKEVWMRPSFPSSTQTAAQVRPKAYRSSIEKQVSDIERSLSTGYDEARIKEVYKVCHQPRRLPSNERRPRGSWHVKTT